MKIPKHFLVLFIVLTHAQLMVGMGHDTDTVKIHNDKDSTMRQSSKKDDELYNSWTKYITQTIPKNLQNPMATLSKLGGTIAQKYRNNSLKMPQSLANLFIPLDPSPTTPISDLKDNDSSQQDQPVVHSQPNATLDWFKSIGIASIIGIYVCFHKDTILKHLSRFLTRVRSTS